MSLLPLSEDQRRWLLVHQSLIPGLINLVINAAIAWGLMHQHAQLSLWGEAAVGPDILITGFLLPFIICLINSRVIPTGVRNGKIPRLDASGLADSGWPRRSPMARSLWLGGLGVVLAAVPMVALLQLGAVSSIPLWTFVGLKGICAGLLAAVVSPVAAYWAWVGASADA
jgi:hypothetical protein